MTKPVTLVTGASRGIGRAAALAFAAAGHHVIALARSQGALESLDDEIKAAGGEVTLVPCDLQDFDALDRLGHAIYQRWGHLDTFFGNAAILGPISPLPHVDPKDWDKVMAINVTANYRLIRSLDLPLRRSSAGRVILMSSAAGNRDVLNPYWGPYAASKAAVDALVRVYAAETRNVSAIKVMAVDPGRLRTRMRAQAVPGEDPETLPLPETLTPHLLKMASPEWQETGKIYNFPKEIVQSFRGPQ